MHAACEIVSFSWAQVNERREERQEKPHPNPPEPLETDTAGQLTERPLTPPQMPVYPEEELLGEIKDQYHRDPFFKKVLDAPKEFRNFVLKDGIMRAKLHDRTTICIPDIKIGDR